MKVLDDDAEDVRVNIGPQRCVVVLCTNIPPDPVLELFRKSGFATLLCLGEHHQAKPVGDAVRETEAVVGGASCRVIRAVVVRVGTLDKVEPPSELELGSVMAVVSPSLASDRAVFGAPASRPTGRGVIGNVEPLVFVNYFSRIEIDLVVMLDAKGICQVCVYVRFCKTLHGHDLMVAI